MRASEYVVLSDLRKSGVILGWKQVRELRDSGMTAFDKEVRLLAAVQPKAHCFAGESDYTSWFMADFNVGQQWLVLSYGQWEDGQYYWNLQENTDVDGPDGIVDLKRSKLFGVVLRYITNLVKAA